MLDVHPPDTKIHGVRDFLLHLFTITVGLLIALALEGCAERWHQHRVRDEADRNLQQEIRDNEISLATTRNAIASEENNLIQTSRFLQARIQNKPFDLSGVTLQFTNAALSDASWRTATATGALSFMDYGRVQQFASVYQEQELFSRLQLEAIDSYLQLHSYAAYGSDPKAISGEEAKAGLADVGKALSHLAGLDQVGAGLQQTYEGALGKK